MYEGTIESMDDVKRFFAHLIHSESLNFHPDTDFCDYISNSNGTPSFTQEQSGRYNCLMEKAFQVCEDKNADIYQLAISEMKGLLDG